ncbi:MAG: nitric oxide reductase activation protein [Pseudomonadota bacterium]
MPGVKIQPAQQLNFIQMEEQLEIYLDPVLSSRRSAANPAAKMAKLTAQQQQFAMHWVKVLTATNAEMAFQFVDKFDQAIVQLENDFDALESWIVDAISAYDRKGLQLSISVLHHPEDFAKNYFNKQRGIELDEINKLLSTFICGLNGRELKIKAAEFSYTDTETIFLPALISDYPSKQENFLYYKLISIFLWAQNWFGTWRYNVNQKIKKYDNPQQALDFFHLLETIRLLNCIRIELPGFYRQIIVFLEPLHKLQKQQQWQAIFLSLNQENASIDDSFLLLEQFYSSHSQPSHCFHDILFPSLLLPHKVLQKKSQRITEDKARFREALSRLADEKNQPKKDPSATITTAAEANFKLTAPDTTMEAVDGQNFVLELDGQTISPPADVQSLISSIIQDLGEIPEEYLVAAGPGKYSMENTKDKNKKDNVWSGVYHEEGAYFYDEWDYIRQHYRKNWCVVREMRITPVHDDFVAFTLKQHITIVKTLRRNFEALKIEEKRLKRQVNGDDIDIDALVESYAELNMGMELNERVFTQMQREDRNIAVMFLVDMSGSTKGWINQLEREALVLLCESLEVLGDRYAIYGFSGTTRKRCEIYHIKHIDEQYNDKVKARISGVSAKDYTRMGFAIRHLTKLLEQVEAKTKLLISLTDGKPEDYDGQYRGEYGIEDTRKSLFETRQKGIHSYCITIDKEAGDYLPYMYGAANYVLIEDINKLPLKVADIYRKLTS